MNLQIFKLGELEDKEKYKVEEFILGTSSNGEFINSIQYLSYHPKDRFIDDSIIVKDINSGVIKCVVMAACSKNKESILISHPGTTFSGPIFKSTQGVSEMDEILDIIFTYYEKKYSKLEFKIQPTTYAFQPMEDLHYIFIKRGYNLGYTALANIINISNLNNEEDIFKLYESKRRNQIKKSMRDYDYIFQKQDCIEEFVWRNMNENLETKFESSTTHSYKEIVELSNMMPKHIVPYIVKKNENQYGAFGLVYKFKNVFHTQYLDLNYKLSKEYPNLLLIHNLIKEAIKEGYQYFSFGASTEHEGEYVNEGLYNYKKGYGGGRIMLPVFRKENY